MKTLIYWQPWPAWRRYLPAALTVLVITVGCALEITGQSEAGFFLPPVILIWLFVPDWAASHLLIFAGGILLVQKGSRFTPIPLSAARWHCFGGFWTFWWKEKEREVTGQIPCDPGTDAMLTAALEQVKAAATAGEQLPQDPWNWTATFHEGGPEVDDLQWLIFLALVVAGAALAFHPVAAFPQALLPLAAAPYLIRSDLKSTVYALTAEGLWVVWPGREPALVPAGEIISVTGTRRQVTIRTRSPWCPVAVMSTRGLGQITLDWIERTKPAA